MIKAPDNSRLFASLVKVVEALRGPNGCPWDKEQTHQTLTRYAIEETHELVEAIDHKNDPEIKEELGDVLLQVVLNSEIARQRGAFDIEDVIEGICKKMVSRHPHVFGDAEVNDSGEVLQKWQELKAQEKASKPQKKNFGIAKGLPALMAAQKIGEKTSHMNFDWKSYEVVSEKVEEEWEEVCAELKTNPSSDSNPNLEKELGDLLFSVAQLCRHLKIDTEQALRKTNERFEKRFFLAQELCEQSGHNWMNLSEDEREGFWRQAKNSIS